MTLGNSCLRTGKVSVVTEVMAEHTLFFNSGRSLHHGLLHPDGLSLILGKNPSPEADAVLRTPGWVERSHPLSAEIAPLFQSYTNGNNFSQYPPYYVLNQI